MGSVGIPLRAILPSPITHPIKNQFQPLLFCVFFCLFVFVCLCVLSPITVVQVDCCWTQAGFLKEGEEQDVNCWNEAPFWEHLPMRMDVRFNITTMHLNVVSNKQTLPPSFQDSVSCRDLPRRSSFAWLEVGFRSQ